ncbi:MAG: NADH-quinone oxidoreductase subunit L [Candidatus Methylomirabilales bacterium]
MMSDFIWLVPALPLAGFVVNILLGRRLSRLWVGVVACGAMGIAFVLSVALFFHLLGLDRSPTRLHQELYTWIGIGDLQASVAFLLDPLSVVMILVVTGVGFLIHIYSVGYMREDSDYSRYFAYLNLFAFFMLLLVLADNYLLLFVGWEGVGLCSYLLIGFWFERPAAAAAAQKAFVVNRVGDAGFLVGIFLLFTTFGTLDYLDIFRQARDVLGVGSPLATAITLALFLGAIGKSAQLPLYVWLPDAMEGPTPVSALIHAATMVTAGVYMVARSSALYDLAPVTLTTLAVTGALTALFAATLALVQQDMKRILAYSTISQLGYMFLACGVGAYAQAIFHLTTHAFFKALLFLAAGSVMHALDGEADIWQMGGLRRKMPVTFFAMAVGIAALAGIPGLSGFFSKDAILYHVWTGLHRIPALWFLGAATAVLTSLYAFRLLLAAFLGACQLGSDRFARLRESPRVMTLPMVLLALLALAGGWLEVPAVLGGKERLSHFLIPSVGPILISLPAGGIDRDLLEIVLMGVSGFLALGGLVAAFWIYRWRPGLSAGMASRCRDLHRLLTHKYYVDELYQGWIVDPLHRLAVLLWQGCDVRVVDGAVNAVAWVMEEGSQRLRRIQTGVVFNYVLSILAGVVLLLGYFILGR